MDWGSIGRRPFVTGAAGGAIGALAMARTAIAQEATNASRNHLVVGSWIVEISFEGQPPTELTSLATYTADGNVLVANAGQVPGLPPGAGLTFTESHGAWTSTGERTADATFVFLTLDQVGSVASINTARTALQVDDSGDSYTGEVELAMQGADGGLTSTARGTFRSTRIRVDPLGAVTATPTP